MCYEISYSESYVRDDAAVVTTTETTTFNDAKTFLDAVREIAWYVNFDENGHVSDENVRTYSISDGKHTIVIK